MLINATRDPWSILWGKTSTAAVTVTAGESESELRMDGEAGKYIL